MIKVAFTKTQSKIKIMVSYLIPLLLRKDFARGVYSQCCYTLLQLKYLPISLIRIKGIQTGDHEIKIIDFADDTNIFLRDTICLNRIQVILKLYEDASSSNFSKVKPYVLEHIKIELINQDK